MQRDQDFSIVEYTIWLVSGHLNADIVFNSSLMSPNLKIKSFPAITWDPFTIS